MRPYEQKSSSVGRRTRAITLFLTFAIAVLGGPSWARADALGRRLIQELERRDKIIKQLVARVKVLEEKIVGLQGRAPTVAAARKPVAPVVAPNRPSALVLSDSELDRIVAGSLPRTFGTGGPAIARGVPAEALIQVSQAAAPKAPAKPAAPGAASTPDTAAPDAAAPGATGATTAPAVADASGEEEERNVLRVPLASVARGGNLLRPGQFQLEPSVNYTYSENTRLIMTGFSVVPLVILGTLESEKVKNNSVASALSFRYGVIRDLQLDASMPFIYSSRSRTRLANDEVRLTRDSESDYSVGDLSFGLTYQPIYESGWIPDVTFSARVRAPTGRSQFDIFHDIAGSGRFGNIEEFVQALDDEGIASGFGFWGLTLGASFVKSADPAVLFGSIGYTVNFRDDVTTVGITQDPRGDAVAIVPRVVRTSFDPGDSLQFSMGFALALNSQMSVNFGFSDRIVFESSIDGVNSGGSGAHAATFNTGFTLAVRPRLSIDVTGAFGLTPDASDFSLGLSMPMTFNSYKDLIPDSWRSG